MIDLGFAALLALISVGLGKRILDGLGCSPDHPLDALALALPLGLGLTALATLALGEVGCLNFVGLAVLLALELELGIIAWFNLFRQTRAWFKTRVQTRSRTSLSLVFAICLGLVLIGTALTALMPVTDGDALCYHLQVPKVFLMRGSVGFLPDLHETVYPLVTEMLYAVALEFRGPVACRGIQWILGLVFAANVTALARPSLGRRAWWAGAVALSVPAVSNGMSAPLNDVALAAFGTAAIFAWVRLHERPGAKAAIVAGLLAGLAIGVKYPALVLCGLLAPTIALRAVIRPFPRQADARPRWLALTGLYLLTALAAGGWWYFRAYVHTGNPVYPFFGEAFGGAGLAVVLDPSKRPLPVTPLNMLSALAPLSLQPDRFDSFSHQFGPVFLLFLPALFLYRAPPRARSRRAGVCVPRHLYDPAPEHAVSLNRAGALVDWCCLRREYLVQSTNDPGSVARRCLGRGDGAGSKPGGRTIAARARDISGPRLVHRVFGPARADIHGGALGASSPPA